MAREEVIKSDFGGEADAEPGTFVWRGQGYLADLTEDELSNITLAEFMEQAKPVQPLSVLPSTPRKPAKDVSTRAYVSKMRGSPDGTH